MPIVPEPPQVVIEQRAHQGEEWDKLVTMGEEAREAKDNSQWLLGDLAVKVAQFFGNEAMPDFAKRIGVEVSTLKRYKTVSEAWPPDTRLPMLSHRHHMVLAGRENRQQLILEAHDSGMTAESLAIELKKQDGKWDDKLAMASMTFARGEVSEIMRWHNEIRTTRPELLNEWSQDVYDKVIKLNQKIEKKVGDKEERKDQ